MHRDIYLDTFAIDRTEVTVGAYRKCVENGPCTEPDTGKFCNWGGEDREEHPVNCVDWNQARTYCAWRGKRLPREAEWEKAARGTDGRKYPWSQNDEPGEQFEFTSESKCPDSSPAWANIGVTTTDSRKRRRWDKFPDGASPYGALDMIGNVWEWVWDAVPGGRGVRGGSWYYPPRSRGRPSASPSSRATGASISGSGAPSSNSSGC